MHEAVQNELTHPLLSQLHEVMTLSLEVEIVVGAKQEIPAHTIRTAREYRVLVDKPVESAEPRQFLLFVFNVCNGDNFVEALELQNKHL